jgi:zinc transport system ATP-binding protein
MPGTTPLLGGEALSIGWTAPLLRGVSFAVGPGESWFVVGANGTGKTSLLLTLLGLLRPLAGTVLPPCGGDRRTLGYVPQEQWFLPSAPLAVREFVGATLADGLGGRVAAACIDAALADLGIGALAARDVRTLSVGQRRRAMLARALARRPSLLVLDEPAAGLDDEAAEALQRDLERLRGNGLAVVQVSHDLHAARRFATHGVRLQAGQAIAGPAAVVFGAGGPA